MARDKKHSKGRLDKYYHMAKEQGYRARSAFKLIQLNKKYNFLEKSRCLVDLCAAPGGWLQVASKYMPKPNVIIGFDLAPIKPIPNVITHVMDITTEKCRSTLKAELKGWKVDVFLHDGAPNVGTSWLQDAFAQNELVLSSLKLATQFLSPNGTFVTKVFRSKDYNKLMWVFNQLFAKVEATKPASSRNVSAEIFVVCREYLAPKNIDSRLLDARWAFKELDDGATDLVLDEKKKRERNSALLNDLLHPEKRRRHREGYEDGDYTLHHSASIHEFITTPDFVQILSSSNQLSFSSNKEDEKIAEHPLTTKEVKACCEDLKLLGKKDFKMLIKWREQMRIILGLDRSKAEIKAEQDAAKEAKENASQDEEELEETLAKEANLLSNRDKREKRKARERKAKVLLKMRMGMDTPMDIGLEAGELGIYAEENLNHDFELPPVKYSSKDTKNATSDNDDDDEENGDIYEDSDDEKEGKISHLESQLDEMFENFKNRQLERDPLAQVKAQKKKLKEGPGAEFEEWYGIEYDLKSDSSGDDAGENIKNAGRGDEEDSDSDLSEDDAEDDHQLVELSSKAQTFFSNPIFQDLKLENESKLSSSKSSKKRGMFDREMNNIDSSEEGQGYGLDGNYLSDNDMSDSDEETAPVVKKRKNNPKKDSSKADGDDYEIVQAGKNEDGEDMEEYAIKTAEAYTLAQKMLTASGRRDVIDNAYNRWTFNDDPGLPSWFLEDENRHNKPQMPVSKDAIKIMRDRMKALDARPIKKIAEAKYRKQLRAMKRAEKLKKKAEVIAEDGDLGDGQKVRDIQKLMAKASKKQQEKKPTLVVAKGGRRGIKGRPKGVKGRYKMVDPRMKKELKAQKRVDKKKKGKR